MWVKNSAGLVPLHRTDDPQRWLGLTYTDDSVITQVVDGYPAGSGLIGEAPSRLEAEQVTTMEIDPEVAAEARKALSDIGFGAVTVITGDGELGYPPDPPTTG